MNGLDISNSIDSRKKFIESMINFQRDCPIIYKLKPRGGYTPYPYSSLEEIMSKIQKILTENGFIITHSTRSLRDNEVMLCTRLTHKDGYYEETSLPIRFEAVVKPSVNATGEMAKAQGAMMTYFRRYGINNLLNLVSEIDLDEITTKPEPSAVKMSDVELKSIISKNLTILVKQLKQRDNINVSGDKIMTTFSGKTYKQIAEELQKIVSNYKAEAVKIIEKIKE